MTDPEFTAEHYSQAAFEFEVKRLPELCPVEFATTKRMLDRWIPDGARIAEIGVGVGHYSEHLAARGCRIHLIDIAQRLLDAAVERLHRSGLGAQIAGVNRLSATDLATIERGAFDAVLLLGPAVSSARARGSAARGCRVREGAEDRRIIVRSGHQPPALLSRALAGTARHGG